MSEWTFQGVPLFFQQDVRGVDPFKIGPVPPRFGLLDDSPDRWARFKSRIEELNASAKPGTSYKVFFLARHGQGFHNVAESKYGTTKWEQHYARLTGDGQLVWGPDPELTALGKSQAATVNLLWKEEMAAGIPIPQKGYCSPLRRAIHTAVLSFDGVIGNMRDIILIVENCREQFGVHTCDRRRTKSEIHTDFPEFQIEDGLTEDDQRWHPGKRETYKLLMGRAKVVLEDIFNNDSATYISITSHGGFIGALVDVLGRPFYALPTGGVLPVVIKGTAVSSQN